MQANTLCIDSSTIDPAVSVQMAAAARTKNNATYLDAPVSGGACMCARARTCTLDIGVMAAQNAALTFMVGGTADGYALAEPLLKFMGKNVVHTGDPGTGQAAKICNNMLLAIGMIGTSEAMNLGQRYKCV
jgi:3-hydroxyisobutyrate dehydrogenase